MLTTHHKNQQSLAVCTANNIGIFRREAWLLYQLSFMVSAGECWLLTGQNGSGKTTLLRILAGLCMPDEGSVTHDNNESPLLYLASPPSKIPELSVIENCRFHALLHWGKCPIASVIHNALSYWEVDCLAAQALASLSQGQQQRVALALLSLGPARLWLLDEPTTGLDAAGIGAFWALCKRYQAQGGSVVVATHQEPKHKMSGLRRIQLCT